MMRRTLVLFLASTFVVLSITLGYALLGFSGPESTIEDARAEFEAGNASKAIRWLDIAESALRNSGDEELRERLVALRYRAYLKAGNLEPALRDLATLREFRPDDPDLARSEVRWTIVGERPEAALALASEWLRGHPDDPAMLELAGESCQAHYQALVRNLVGELNLLLDHESAEQAFAALRHWLYGSDKDPATERALHRFEAIIREVSPDRYATGEFNEPMDTVRQFIKRAQTFFAKALESDGEPVAAYHGLAYAMRQAGRNDDRAWLGELYLHRFDHLFRLDAANDLAQLHLEAGRDRAVLDLRARVLPGETWRTALDEGRLDRRIRHLLLAQARSLDTLKDGPGLQTLVTEVEQMTGAGLDLAPESYWIEALAAARTEQLPKAIQLLGVYDRETRRLVQTEDVVENRLTALRTRINLARSADRADRFFERTLRELQALDPNDPTPIVERSRFQIAGDDPEGALIELRNARRIAQYDEAVLRLWAEALEAKLGKINRGAEAQLRRCITLDDGIPSDIQDPMLLPLAELALERKEYDIAIAAAQRASEVYNWARWPREVQARAAFAAGRPEIAQQAAEATLSYSPGDVTALRDLRRAREILGRPIDDLIPDLLIAGEVDGDIAAALLDKAMNRQDLSVARPLAAAIEERFADDPEALLSVADVHEASGDRQAAKQTLQRAADLTINVAPEQFREAFNRLLVLTAATEDDPYKIRFFLEQAPEQNEGRTEALVELAQRLRAVDRPKEAYLLMENVLTHQSHKDQRSGQHFLLGGQLARELGKYDRAVDYLVAAVSFDDSATANRELTLLQLALGHEEAASASWVSRDVVDLTSACLAIRFGARDAALRWVKSRRAMAPFDAPVGLIAALLDPEKLGPPDPKLLDLAKTHGVLVLDTLTFLGDPGFARFAVLRADALCKASADHPYALILKARALAAHGAPKQCVDLLTRVITEYPLMLPAYDEAIRTLEAAGIDPAQDNTPLIGQLTRDELLQNRLATPDMMALATRRQAAQLVQALGKESTALESLSTLWLSHPIDSGASLDHVDFLARIGRLDLAIQLAEVLEPRIDRSERQRFLAVYFSLVSSEIQRTQDPELIRRAVTKARKIRRDEATFGIIANFLVDRDLADNGPLDPRAEPERVARIRDILLEHIALVRSGEDRYVKMVEQTLLRLEEIAGRTHALEVCESLLRLDASMLELWILRARWLALDGDSDQALEGLRWTYDYVPTHAVTLRVVEFAAFDGMSTDRDYQTVHEQLDEDVRSSPDGKLTAGLLAVRRAEHEEAARLLAEAAPRPDGRQLYFLGLARLRQGDADGATAALEALLSQYPDSPLAANARHFVRQLR